MLFGSVIVIVGATVYPDPGSNSLIAKILLFDTYARALVVAPTNIELATVPAVLLCTATQMPLWLGLPWATPLKPLAAVLVVLEVQFIPSSEQLVLTGLLLKTRLDRRQFLSIVQ